MEEVRNYYDKNPLIEWERLERHRLEFDSTKKIFDNFIPKIKDSKIRIADIGGGPGRYSLYLASKGYEVTLVDLSCENICLAIQKSEELGIAFDGVFNANALDLDILEDDSYDVCLLMGPLYHLLEENKRNQAVEETVKKLKKGGTIITSFISRFAPLCDILKNYPDIILKQKNQLLELIKDGRNIPSEENPGFTHAYFSTARESVELLEKNGIETMRISSIESLASLREKELYALSDEIYDKWVDLIYEISTEPSIIGASEHLIHVGKKL